MLSKPSVIPAQRKYHSVVLNSGDFSSFRFEELNDEASGKSSQSAEAAKAEKALDVSGC